MSNGTCRNDTVPPAVSDTAADALCIEIQSITPHMSATDLKDQIDKLDKTINSVLCCSYRSWLIREPDVPQLGIDVVPYGKERHTLSVFPHVASQTIRTQSMSLLEEIPPRARERLDSLLIAAPQLGKVDGVTQSHNGSPMRIDTVFNGMRSIIDNRAAGLVTPRMTQHFRQRVKFDRDVLFLMCIVTQVLGCSPADERTTHILENGLFSMAKLPVALDVYNALKSHNRAMFREFVADFLAGSEAILRQHWLDHLSIKLRVAERASHLTAQSEPVVANTHTDTSSALEEQHLPMLQQARGTHQSDVIYANVALEALVFILISWALGIVLTVLSFTLRDKLNTDPMSILLAVVTLIFVTVTVLVRDRYHPELHVAELLTERIDPGRPRLVNLTLDEKQTMALLNSPSLENIRGMISARNASYLGPTFPGEDAVGLQPVPVCEAYRNLSRVVTKNRLPGMRFMSVVSEVDLGLSTSELIRMVPASSVVSEESVSWICDMGCKMGGLPELEETV